MLLANRGVGGEWEAAMVALGERLMKEEGTEGVPAAHFAFLVAGIAPGSDEAMARGMGMIGAAVK